MARENAEEALDQIHPRGVGRDVVEVDAPVTLQPLLSGFILMNVEIIQHDVQGLSGQAATTSSMKRRKLTEVRRCLTWGKSGEIGDGEIGKSGTGKSGTDYSLLELVEGAGGMGRIARIVIPGLPHPVTQRGNRRSEVFRDAEDLRVYLSLAGKYAGE